MRFICILIFVVLLLLTSLMRLAVLFILLLLTSLMRLADPLTVISLHHPCILQEGSCFTDYRWCHLLEFNRYIPICICTLNKHPIQSIRRRFLIHILQRRKKKITTFLKLLSFIHIRCFVDQIRLKVHILLLCLIRKTFLYLHPPR